MLLVSGSKHLIQCWLFCILLNNSESTSCNIQSKSQKSTGKTTLEEPAKQNMRTLGIPITIRTGADVSYRRSPARCWIRTAVTQISGTIRLCHTTLQQHLRRQIIRSSRSACVERPSCYPSQHWADNGHFLQTSQNCFVYWYMRSRRICDILILSRPL